MNRRGSTAWGLAIAAVLIGCSSDDSFSRFERVRSDGGGTNGLARTAYRLVGDENGREAPEELPGNWDAAGPYQVVQAAVRSRAQVQRAWFAGRGTGTKFCPVCRETFSDERRYCPIHGVTLFQLDQRRPMPCTTLTASEKTTGACGSHWAS